MTGRAASTWADVVNRSNLEVNAKWIISFRLSCISRWPQNQGILTTVGTISPCTEYAIRQKRTGFVVGN